MLTIMIHPNNGKPKYWAYDSETKECCYGPMAGASGGSLSKTKATPMDKHKKGYVVILEAQPPYNAYTYFSALEEVAQNLRNGGLKPQMDLEVYILFDEIISRIVRSGVDMGAARMPDRSNAIHTEEKPTQKKKIDIPQMFVTSDDDALSF